MRLENQVAIVTGASQGIGRAISLAYAEEGADVVLVARTKSALEEVATEVGVRGQEALVVPTDVSNEQDVEAMMTEAIDRFGRVDAMVNNAGVIFIGPFLESTLEEWETTMAVNLRGVYLGCRAVLPHMLEQGSGVILNISSGAGKRGIPEWEAYCASKFGVIGLTESLAKEFDDSGVRINAIAPGRTDTPMQHRIRPGIDPDTLMAPRDVADIAMFLASDEARAIHGAAIDVHKA